MSDTRKLIQSIIDGNLVQAKEEAFELLYSQAETQLSEKKLEMASTLFGEGKKMDPVGKEDDDVDNDGDVDDSDEYLKNRRKKVSNAIKADEAYDENMELAPKGKGKKASKELYAHKGTHYFKGGKPYNGPVHKMDGEIHTGEKHTKDSKQVFHSKKDAMEAMRYDEQYKMKKEMKKGAKQMDEKGLGGGGGGFVPGGGLGGGGKSKGKGGGSKPAFSKKTSTGRDTSQVKPNQRQDMAGTGARSDSDRETYVTPASQRAMANRSRTAPSRGKKKKSEEEDE